MNDKPQLAVILVNWNNTDDTLQTIKELQKQTFRQFIIVVIDNKSEKNPKEILMKQDPSLVYIQANKNLGYSGGNNKGLAYAIKEKIPYVMFLNSDVFLHKNCLQALMKTMESNPSVGAVSPKIYYYQEKKKIWFIDGPINWVKGTTHSRYQGTIDHGQFNKSRETDRIPGTAFLTRTAILQKIGGFDETYFMYMEDVDLCIRINKAGYKILVNPRAIIWHNESAVSGGAKAARIIYYYTRNKLFFMKKHAPKLFFVTSFLYELYFCLRRFASHIIKRQLSITTIKVTILAFSDFLRNRSGKTYL